MRALRIFHQQRAALQGGKKLLDLPGVCRRQAGKAHAGQLGKGTCGKALQIGFIIRSGAAVLHPVPEHQFLLQRLGGGRRGRTSARCIRAVCGGHQDDVGGERRVVPRHLRPVRCRHHILPHALEHGFDAGAGHQKLPGNRRRIGAVEPLAVRCRAAGSRCKGNETAARRARQQRQPARAAACGAGQRRVAAGIEDDDVRPVMGLFHRRQHPVHRQRLELRIHFLAQVRAERGQIIAPAGGKAVAGVIDRSQRAGGRGLEPCGEVAHGSLHGTQIRIHHQRHLKACGLEAAGNQRRIIGRVFQGGQGRAVIGGIADHQREAAGRVLRPCRSHRTQQHEAENQNGHHPRHQSGGLCHRLPRPAVSLSHRLSCPE